MPGISSREIFAARHHVLTGMAHQPYLEWASTVAQLIRSAVTES